MMTGGSGGEIKCTVCIGKKSRKITQEKMFARKKVFIRKVMEAITKPFHEVVKHISYEELLQTK